MGGCHSTLLCRRRSDSPPTAYSASSSASASASASGSASGASRSPASLDGQADTIRALSPGERRVALAAGKATGGAFHLEQENEAAMHAPRVAPAYASSTPASTSSATATRTHVSHSTQPPTARHSELQLTTLHQELPSASGSAAASVRNSPRGKTSAQMQKSHHLLAVPTAEGDGEEEERNNDSKSKSSGTKKKKSSKSKKKDKVSTSSGGSKSAHTSLKKKSKANKKDGSSVTAASSKENTLKKKKATKTKATRTKVKSSVVPDPSAPYNKHAPPPTHSEEEVDDQDEEGDEEDMEKPPLLRQWSEDEEDEKTARSLRNLEAEMVLAEQAAFIQNQLQIQLQLLQEEQFQQQQQQQHVQGQQQGGGAGGWSPDSSGPPSARSSTSVTPRPHLQHSDAGAAPTSTLSVHMQFPSNQPPPSLHVHIESSVGSECGTSMVVSPSEMQGSLQLPSPTQLLFGTHTHNLSTATSPAPSPSSGTNMDAGVGRTQPAGSLHSTVPTPPGRALGTSSSFVSPTHTPRKSVGEGGGGAHTPRTTAGSVTFQVPTTFPSHPVVGGGYSTPIGKQSTRSPLHFTHGSSTPQSLPFSNAEILDDTGAMIYSPTGSRTALAFLRAGNSAATSPHASGRSSPNHLASPTSAGLGLGHLKTLSLSMSTGAALRAFSKTVPNSPMNMSPAASRSSSPGPRLSPRERVGSAKQRPGGGGATDGGNGSGSSSVAGSVVGGAHLTVPTGLAAPRATRLHPRRVLMPLTTTESSSTTLTASGIVRTRPPPIHSHSRSVHSSPHRHPSTHILQHSSRASDLSGLPREPASARGAGPGAPLPSQGMKHSQSQHVMPSRARMGGAGVGGEHTPLIKEPHTAGVIGAHSHIHHPHPQPVVHRDRANALQGNPLLQPFNPDLITPTTVTPPPPEAMLFERGSGSGSGSNLIVVPPQSNSTPPLPAEIHSAKPPLSSRGGGGSGGKHRRVQTMNNSMVPPPGLHSPTHTHAAPASVTTNTTSPTHATTSATHTSSYQRFMQRLKGGALPTVNTSQAHLANGAHMQPHSAALPSTPPAHTAERGGATHSHAASAAPPAPVPVAPLPTVNNKSLAWASPATTAALVPPSSARLSVPMLHAYVPDAEESTPNSARRMQMGSRRHSRG